MSSSSCPTCRRSADNGDAFCAHCGRSVAVAPASTPVARGRRRTPLVLAAVVAGLIVSTLAVTGVRGWRSEPQPERMPWTEMPVEEEVTVESVTVEEVTVPDTLVGPTGEGVRERPMLLNGEEVGEAISRAYPPLLRDAGVPGDAEVRFQLQADGTVDPASAVVLSATHEAFAEAARQVVRTMRFTPARVDGEAIPVEMVLPVSFRPQPAPCPGGAPDCAIRSDASLGSSHAPGFP